VFSASLPPYLAVAADCALSILEEEPERLETLRENTAALRAGLANTPSIQVLGNHLSPIVILQLTHPSEDRLQNDILLQEIVEEALAHGVLVTRSKHSQDRFGDHQPPSIRMLVTAGHSRTDITQVAVPVIHNACLRCLSASQSSPAGASSSPRSHAATFPTSPAGTSSPSAPPPGFSTPKASLASPSRLRSGRKIRR
jgi:Aminotransferase class I and II